MFSRIPIQHGKTTKESISVAFNDGKRRAFVIAVLMEGGSSKIVF